MDKANRKAIIAGNWKMNKTATEAAALIDELIPAVKDADCEVVICTPFTSLVTAVEKTRGTNIHVGAENVHFEKSGAFTRRNQRRHAGGSGRGIRHHRPFRAPPVLRRDRRDREQAHPRCSGRRLKVIVCVGENLTQREQALPRNWFVCRPRSRCVT